jgi:hypothetical protein
MLTWTGVVYQASMHCEVHTPSSGGFGGYIGSHRPQVLEYFGLIGGL